MRIATRICLFAVLFLGAFRAHATTDLLCELLLKGGKIEKPAITVSQAQRVSELLTKLTPEVRQQIYGTLSSQNLAGVSRDMRGDKLSAQRKALLDANPGLDMAVQDLSEFGNIFPGIFALANADMMVFKVLNVVRQREVDGKAEHMDLLQSESLAPRLRRTIDNSLINLIEQAEMEYEGDAFGLSTFQYYWYKTTRFFFPSYHKVAQIIDYAQEYEKQLTRLQLVDRLVIKLALSDAASLGLTDPEVEQLTMQVLKSPSEIQDIEKEMTKILGQNFKVGQEAEIGKFDIRKSFAVTDAKNWPSQLEKFDQVNLAALELLNRQLNAARARKGQAARNLQQFDITELQLYFEAHERRLEYFKDEYLEITGQTANESYTVEDRHTRQEDTGQKDKDGHAIYRTVEYFTDRTVHPSFEDILSNTYDTGDRNVSGLDPIKERAHLLYLKELGPRNLIAEAHRLVSKVVDGYENAIGMDKDRDALMKAMSDQIARLQAAQKDYSVYAAWSPESITRQYTKDSVKNFQQRNAMMLNRMDNAVKLLVELTELMRRRQPQLTPAFDMFDYSNWLNRLRRYRNWNYTKKAFLTGVPTAGVALYNLVPQVQMQMDQWSSHAATLIQQFFGN
jgi:hypothetical protein